MVLTSIELPYDDSDLLFDPLMLSTYSIRLRRVTYKALATKYVLDSYFDLL